ncbi:hypothetical protein AK812_SmicGene9417 [Symbiodinium microadriaticum]|uniref:Uncharacterized protein n=1 Tax=Symbiodinium microadriaticum TaxID=2951 RepID=A0A1Q9EIN3_SYMMI|nr:hypothetical protein AK812_SmicGene9417 [Symbiodinium microadriaticum]
MEAGRWWAAAAAEAEAVTVRATELTAIEAGVEVGEAAAVALELAWAELETGSSFFENRCKEQKESWTSGLAWDYDENAKQAQSHSGRDRSSSEDQLAARAKLDLVLASRDFDPGDLLDAIEAELGMESPISVSRLALVFDDATSLLRSLRLLAKVALQCLEYDQSHTYQVLWIQNDFAHPACDGSREVSLGLQLERESPEVSELRLVLRGLLQAKKTSSQLLEAALEAWLLEQDGRLQPSEAESMATESVADPQETTEVESQKQDEEEEGKVGKETSSKQGSDGEGFKVEAKPETSPEELVDAKDSEPSQAQAPEREADAANAGTTSVDASASLGDAEASAALAMEELEPMPPSGDADDLGPGQASDQADVADLQGDAEPKPKAARPTSAEASPEESGAQPAGPETTEALPEIVASGTTATEADGSQGLRLKEAAASASEDGPADPSGAQAAAEEQPTVSVVQDPVALQSAKQKHKVKAVPTQAQQFVSLAGKSAVTPSVDEDAHRFSKAEPVQAAGVEASPGSASPPPPPPPVSALEAKSISGMPPGGYKDSAAVGASNGPDTDSGLRAKPSPPAAPPAPTAEAKAKPSDEGQGGSPAILSMSPKNGAKPLPPAAPAAPTAESKATPSPAHAKASQPETADAAQGVPPAIPSTPPKKGAMPLPPAAPPAPTAEAKATPSPAHAKASQPETADAAQGVPPAIPSTPPKKGAMPLPPAAPPAPTAEAKATPSPAHAKASQLETVDAAQGVPPAIPSTPPKNGAKPLPPAAPAAPTAESKATPSPAHAKASQPETADAAQGVPPAIPSTPPKKGAMPLPPAAPPPPTADAGQGGLLPATAQIQRSPPHAVSATLARSPGPAAPVPPAAAVPASAALPVPPPPPGPPPKPTTETALLSRPPVDTQPNSAPATDVGSSQALDEEVERKLAPRRQDPSHGAGPPEETSGTWQGVGLRRQAIDELQLVPEESQHSKTGPQRPALHGRDPNEAIGVEPDGDVPVAAEQAVHAPQPCHALARPDDAPPGLEQGAEPAESAPETCSNASRRRQAIDELQLVPEESQHSKTGPQRPALHGRDPNEAIGVEPDGDVPVAAEQAVHAPQPSPTTHRLDPNREQSQQSLHLLEQTLPKGALEGVEAGAVPAEDYRTSKSAPSSGGDRTRRGPKGRHTRTAVRAALK